MGVNEEALQLHAVYKKPYFYYKSHENLYQVLQVTCAASDCAMKLKVRMIKIIITIVPSYRLLLLALLLVLRTRNITDGSKLMIFSGIALYYGKSA